MAKSAEGWAEAAIGGCGCVKCGAAIGGRGAGRVDGAADSEAGVRLRWAARAGEEEDKASDGARRCDQPCQNSAFLADRCNRQQNAGRARHRWCGTHRARRRQPTFLKHPGAASRQLADTIGDRVPRTRPCEGTGHHGMPRPTRATGKIGKMELGEIGGMGQLAGAATISANPRHQPAASPK